MRPRYLGFALLLSQAALVGCSSTAGKADDTTAEEMVTKQLQSDRAGLIFAQQEFVLAQAHASRAESHDVSALTKPVEAAQAHRSAAQFMVKMDEEDAVWERDMSAWKTYVKANSADTRN